MASGSLLTLLDDIATLLDDVATMTKVATQKTTGLLADDLAVNAEQVSGVRADRELPVVWAVAKGSALNKALLVPAALAISAFAPWAIIPLLMVGGTWLCFEGFEKVAHAWLDAPDEKKARRAERVRLMARSPAELLAFEKEKIRGAIRTDFVLSAEIIVIALGTVTGASLLTQSAVLVGVAVLITAGVYGLVAGIVKMDDAGLSLSRRPSAAARSVGRGLLVFAPWFMKFLSVAGTAAMFLVGGGILVHGIPVLHHWVEVSASQAAVYPAGALLVEYTVAAVLGVLVGAMAVGAALGVARLRRAKVG